MSEAEAVSDAVEAYEFSKVLSIQPVRLYVRKHEPRYDTYGLHLSRLRSGVNELHSTPEDMMASSNEGTLNALFSEWGQSRFDETCFWTEDSTREFCWRSETWWKRLGFDFGGPESWVREIREQYLKLKTWSNIDLECLCLCSCPRRNLDHIGRTLWLFVPSNIFPTLYPDTVLTISSRSEITITRFHPSDIALSFCTTSTGLLWRWTCPTALV